MPMASNYVESLRVDVMCGDITINVINTYTPPQNRVTSSAYDHIAQGLGTHSIVCGDFNAFHTSWGSEYTSVRGIKLHYFIEDNQLVYLNQGEGTRYNARTGVTTPLDLTLVSPNLVTKCTWKIDYDNGTWGSDHYPVEVIINQPPSLSGTGYTPGWMSHKADWEGLYRDCEEKVQSEYVADDDINVHCSNFTTAIMKCAVDNIPRSSGKPRTFNPVPWWSADIRKAILARNRAQNKARRNFKPDDLADYRKKKQVAKKLVLKAKQKHWRDFCSSINYKTDSRKVWRKIKNIQGAQQSDIPVLGKNAEAVDNKAKSNLLATTFAQYSSDAAVHPDVKSHQDFVAEKFHKIIHDPEEPHFIPVGPSYPERSVKPFNQEYQMKELLQALACKKDSAVGHDCISYNILKHSPIITKWALLDLINRIWIEGKVPEAWKIATVIPLPKKGKPPEEPTSYRPISLTSHMCKVMETMVNTRLNHYMESNGLYTPNQSGFRRGRSTTDQIVRLETDIQHAKNSGGYLVAVFLDIEKAYDMLWTDGLLIQLKKYGITGRMFSYISDFLRDRKMQVRVGTTLSEMQDMERGTPQGSCISPTLFNIMVNDFDKNLLADTQTGTDPLEVSQFADDGALWKYSPNLDHAISVVQLQLKKVKVWSDSRGFKISQSKTKAVIFTNKRDKDPEPRKLTLAGVTIDYSETAEFLGLNWDRRLTWEVHITELIKRCNKDMNVMRILSGTTWGADKRMLLTMYQSLILSKLMYGCEAFDSASNNLLKGLDRVQNQALRIITGAIRNTAISSLEVETGQLPLQLKRNEAILKYWARSKAIANLPSAKVSEDEMRLAYLKPNRPGRKSYGISAMNLVKDSGLSNTSIACQTPIPSSPWRFPRILVSTLLTKITSKTDLPARTKAIVEEHIDELWGEGLHIYTDGSKNPDTGVTAAGYVIPSIGISESIRLPDNLSVYSTELIAIHQSLIRVQELHSKGEITYPYEVTIFSDSLSSLQSIENERSKARNDLVQVVIKEHNAVYELGVTIQLVWVPSHIGLPGNEKADMAAKNGLSLQPPHPNYNIGHRECNSIIRSYINKQWQEQWSSTPKGRWLFHLKPRVNRTMISYSSNRKNDKIITKLILGNTRLNGDIAKMVPDMCDECDYCKHRNTTNHYINHCDKFNVERSQLLERASQLGIENAKMDNILIPPAKLRPTVHSLLFDFVISTGQYDKL
jgi:ribonuclease HI